MDDYLTKPLRKPDLLGMLTKAVQNRRILQFHSPLDFVRDSDGRVIFSMTKWWLVPPPKIGNPDPLTGSDRIESFLVCQTLTTLTLHLTFHPLLRCTYLDSIAIFLFCRFCLFLRTFFSSVFPNRRFLFALRFYKFCHSWLEKLSFSFFFGLWVHIFSNST